ncbi:MAG: deoxyribonuclease IV [Thermogutta sp.]
MARRDLPLLGAHMSIAGGYRRAVERATAVGCQCLQLFTKNSNQWRDPEVTEEQARAFREAMRNSGMSAAVSHDSYLINLASPDESLWNRSIDALAAELQRADLLGLDYVVAHPGAYIEGGEAAGLNRIARAIDRIHERLPKLQTQLLLETTAGQGTHLGRRFEHLATVIETVRHPRRIGVCFDTCHVFAAGYPLHRPRGWNAVLREFDAVVGLSKIRAVHINDSRADFGSRVDRHAHIGQGKIGLDAFRRLVRDDRLVTVPMYLETPKGTDPEGRDWDAINLDLLRKLARSR